MMEFARLEVYVFISLLIFLARVADVSIGTIRIVFVSKGLKYAAPILGFFEVLIWLTAMTKIFENLDYWFYSIFYAAGFATGTWVGLWIEERIAIGNRHLRIITQHHSEELVGQLSRSGYGVTSLKADGSKGKVDIIFCILPRADVPKALQLIQEIHPEAFYTIEEVKLANKGVFPMSHKQISRLGNWRPGK